MSTAAATQGRGEGGNWRLKNRDCPGSTFHRTILPSTDDHDCGCDCLIDHVNHGKVQRENAPSTRAPGLDLGEA